MKRDLAPSEEHAREEHALSELGKLTARALDKGALLQAVLEHTLDLTGLAAGGIYEVDPQTGQGEAFRAPGRSCPLGRSGAEGPGSPGSPQGSGPCSLGGGHRQQERERRRPAEAMVGQHWSAFVAPEDGEEVHRRVAMRPLGQSERYTARLLKADGTRVPCLISARPLFEEGRYVGTLSVVTDLSERMARERELQEAKEYLENLIRALPVGILRLNPKGEVIDMNPALEEMVGATAEERRKSGSLAWEEGVRSPPMGL